MPEGLEFYHVSPIPWDVTVMDSTDYEKRPHYELFREPLNTDFLSIDRFLSDRKLEAAFEAVRLKIVPRAPSRKTCLFAFVCVQCARWFKRSSSARRSGTILRVTPTSDSTIFLTDLIWRNVAANVLMKDVWRLEEFPYPSNDRDEALAKIAGAYWRGENPRRVEMDSRPECLIDGRLNVLAKVE